MITTKTDPRQRGAEHFDPATPFLPTARVHSPGGGYEPDRSGGSTTPIDQLQRVLDTLTPATTVAIDLNFFELEPPAGASGQGGRRSPRNLRRSLIAADVLAAAVGTAAAFAIQEFAKPVPASVRREHLLLFVAAVPVWIIALFANKMYVARAIERVGEEARRLWLSCAMGTGAAVCVAFILQYKALSRLWVVLLLVCVGAALSLERLLIRKWFAHLRSSGQIRRRVAIIGQDSEALRLFRLMRTCPHLGYEPVGFIGEPNQGIPAQAILGPVELADDILLRHTCVGAVVSLSSVAPEQVNVLARRLTDLGYHVALSSSLNDIDVARIRPQSLDGQTLLYIEHTIRDGWRARAKRVADVAIAVVGLILSAPVVLIAAIAIKLESKGPIFFAQPRVGKDGVEFRILKLRTMVTDAERQKAELMHRNESDGPLFKMSNDPRITRVGRVLRIWSIDELPQFVNVIGGQMSVVGPRPALPSEVAQWDRLTSERLRVLPGITGQWQVGGRSGTTFEQYKRLDLAYVDNWSLVHDLRIVIRTIGVVLLRKGAR